MHDSDMDDDPHAYMEARGARCRECALYRCGQGPVKSDLISNPKLTILAEAPGKHEVEWGRNFAGAVGEELDAALEQGGLSRDECSLINVVACKPQSQTGGLSDYLQDLARQRKLNPNGTHALDPVTACKGRVLSELQQSKTQVTLAIGGRALETLAEYKGLKYGRSKTVPGTVTVSTIKKQHGAPVPLPDGSIICAALHPAYALREAKHYKYVIRDDIARAAAIARRGKIAWTPPEHTYVFPTLATIERVLRRFRSTDVQVTVDIETDGLDPRTSKIRCIGIGARIDGAEHIVVVPFWWKNGTRYWTSDDDFAKAEALVRDVLDNNPLVFHNGQFDTSVCLARGLMTRRDRIFDDTMIAHHDTDHNDLPHDLGFVTARFFEIPMWKADADHKTTEGTETDRDLHDYNALDVSSTLRVWEQLQQRVAACGTTPQYQTDKQIARIARDMTLLGLFIDEKKRGELSVKLGALCNAFERKFVEQVGRHINIRSSQQIGKWLFGEVGMTPSLTPKGFEWKPGDEWSTSTDALKKVLDSGACPANVAQALERLLSYRAAETLRGRYVDGLLVQYHDGVIDEREPAVVVEGQQRLPDRPALSRLFPTWKVHVTPCVTPDTWILGQNGPTQIGRYAQFPADGFECAAPAGLRLFDGTQLQDVGHLVNPGVRDTRTIKTALGLSLTATPNHQLIVAGGKFDKSGPRDATGHRECILLEPEQVWRRTDEIRPGDYLRVPIGQNIWGAGSAIRFALDPERPLVGKGSVPRHITAPTAPSLDLAEFVGIYNADGSLHDAGGSFSIRISNRAPPVQERVIALMTRLFGRCAVSKSNVSITSIRLRGWAEQVGLRRRIENKCCPQWILESPREFVEAYLRGLSLDSRVMVDGRKTPYWRYTGSHALAQEVQMLLLNIGVVASLVDRRRPGHELTWSVGVTGNTDVAKISAITGQPFEQQPQSGDRCRPKYWRRGNDLWLRVLSNVPSGQQRVLDVTVDRTNRFWSNGFVSHNTGRWSSSPAAQNWPARAWGGLNLRSLIVAPPGHVLVGADYEQIELRLYAVQANDQKVLEVFYNDMDAHSYNAATIMSKTGKEDEVMALYKQYVAWKKSDDPEEKLRVKQIRNIAKRFVFLLIYGGEEDKLFSVMSTARDKATGLLEFPNLDPTEVLEWNDRWHSAHPETKRWQKECADFCRQHGYVKAIGDERRRYFLGGASKKNSIPNHTIQGSSAYIANRATILLDQAIPFQSWSEYTGLCLQVHDYLCACVPIDKADYTVGLLKEIMPYSLPSGFTFPVDKPLATRSWAEQG